jgi:simple sugar transport system permease protein
MTPVDAPPATGEDVRDAMPAVRRVRAWRHFLPLVLGGLLALLVGGLVVAAVGVSPLSSYKALWNGAFGQRRAVGETLLRFITFATVGLGLLPALRARVFTVGAEGQLIAGALLAGLTAIELGNALAPPVVIAAAAIAGMLAGALWALGPALMAARLGVNIILSTLALNFIARYLLAWLLSGPVKASGASLAQSEMTPRDTWLPILLPGSRAHIGVLVVLALSLLLAVHSRAVGGYRVRLYGSSPSLAQVAGVRGGRVIVRTVVFAGAIAGLAGWMQVAGADRAVFVTIATGTGFIGLLVAFLGNLTVAGTILASLFFAALSNGADFMQIEAGVSPQLIEVIQGVALLVVAARLPDRLVR